MTQLHDTPQPQDVAARVRAALASPDPDALGPLLDDNVRWGGEEDTPETCHTRSDVLNRLAAQRAAGVQTQVVEVLASDESIVLGLTVKRPIDGGFARERTVYQVLTLRNGLIADIRGYPTRAEAAARAGLGPATTRGIEAREVIPILNVSSLLDSFDWFAKPLKSICLRACRSPFGFLIGNWRAGVDGTLRLGLVHAAYCVGCCCALMAVLVAAGAMGLAWIVLVTLAVFCEKVLPRGERTARAIGLALLAMGVVVAAQPGMVAGLRGGM